VQQDANQPVSSVYALIVLGPCSSYCIATALQSLFLDSMTTPYKKQQNVWRRHSFATTVHASSVLSAADLLTGPVPGLSGQTY
jgi:hypothetical protein